MIKTICLILLSAQLFAAQTAQVRAPEKPDFSKWQILSGRWDVSGEKVRGISGSGEGVLLSPIECADFVMEYTVSVKRREGSAIFRYKDKNNTYLLVFAPKEGVDSQGSLLLIRRVNGKETYFAGFEVYTKTNEPIAVRIKCAGSILEVSANNKLGVTVFDPNFASGRIGLRVYGDFINGSEAEFSDITVKQAGSQK